MFSRVNAKAGVSRFPPPRPTDGSPRSNSPPSGPSLRGGPELAQEVERHLALPTRPTSVPTGISLSTGSR